MATILIIPGLRGSGPDHWQTWWQAHEPAAVRVEQTDWQTPDPVRWSERIRQAMHRAEAPVWLVAHSFGCLAAVHAAARSPERVAGALWVAPANPDKFGIAAELPARPLPYPNLLVASRNDPWMDFEHARIWSLRWGSRLVDLGCAGHINAESGYGAWPQGPILLRELQEAKAAPSQGFPRQPAQGPRDSALGISKTSDGIKENHHASAIPD